MKFEPGDIVEVVDDGAVYGDGAIGIVCNACWWDGDRYRNCTPIKLITQPKDGISGNERGPYTSRLRKIGHVEVRNENAV